MINQHIRLPETKSHLFFAGCEAPPASIASDMMKKKLAPKKSSSTSIGEILRARRAAEEKTSEVEEALAKSKAETQRKAEQLSTAEKKIQVLEAHILEANTTIVELKNIISSEKLLVQVLEERDDGHSAKILELEVALDAEMERVQKLETAAAQAEENSCDLAMLLVFEQCRADAAEEIRNRSAATIRLLEAELGTEKERSCALEMRGKKAECQLYELNHCIDIQEDRLQILGMNEEKWQLHVTDMNQQLTLEREKASEFCEALAVAEEVIEGMEEQLAAGKRTVSRKVQLLEDAETRIEEAENSLYRAETTSTETPLSVERKILDQNSRSRHLGGAFGFCRVVFVGILTAQCLQKCFKMCFRVIGAPSQKDDEEHSP